MKAINLVWAAVPRHDATCADARDERIHTGMREATRASVRRKARMWNDEGKRGKQISRNEVAICRG